MSEPNSAKKFPAATRTKALSIAIIGGGAMGSSLARGLLSTGLVTPYSLTVYEPEEGRKAALMNLGVLNVRSTPDQRLGDHDLVVLAVKPQVAQEALREISPFLKAGQLALSVMAGVRIASIVTSLPNGVLVARSMPNLAAFVGAGVTALYLPAELSLQQRELVNQTLSAIGSVVEVDTEQLINSATAISGSGPGYLFHIAQQLVEAAIEIGFSYAQASELVRQTMIGSAELLKQESASFIELRDKVTSKGGTTEACLTSWHQAGFDRTLKEGVMQAKARAEELEG